MSGVTERKFQVTDGSARLEVAWSTATELPDCHEAGIVAARKVDGAYEYATAACSCPTCHETIRVTASSPRTEAMALVDLEKATVVETECLSIAGAMLDAEALVLLEILGNVSFDEEQVYFAECPTCGRRFPVRFRPDTREVIVKATNSGVEIRDYRTRGLELTFDGEFDPWRMDEHDSSRDKLRRFSTLNGFVMGVSAECRQFIDIALGLRPGWPIVEDAVDVVDIALRNRFRHGYDERFIRTAREVVGKVDCRIGNDLEPGAGLLELPRGLDDRAIADIVERNWWQDDPAMKVAVRTNLAIAAIMAYGNLGRVCAGDRDAALTLLQPGILDVDFLYALYDNSGYCEGGLSNLFLAASMIEEPNELVSAVLDMGSDGVRRANRRFAETGLGKLQAYVAYESARREFTLQEILQEPGLLRRRETHPRAIRIRYGERERSLAGDFGGFRFSLPADTGSILSVSRSIGADCLWHGGVEAAFGEAVIVHVASWDRFVALIKLEHGARVIRSVTGRGGKRLRKDGKVARAIADWADCNGMAYRDDRFIFDED